MGTVWTTTTSGPHRYHRRRHRTLTSTWDRERPRSPGDRRTSVEDSGWTDRTGVLGGNVGTSRSNHVPPRGARSFPPKNTRQDPLALTLPGKGRPEGHTQEATIAPAQQPVCPPTPPTPGGTLPRTCLTGPHPFGRGPGSLRSGFCRSLVPTWDDLWDPSHTPPPAFGSREGPGTQVSGTSAHRPVFPRRRRNPVPTTREGVLWGSTHTVSCPRTSPGSGSVPGRCVLGTGHSLPLTAPGRPSLTPPFCPTRQALVGQGTQGLRVPLPHCPPLFVPQVRERGFSRRSLRHSGTGPLPVRPGYGSRGEVSPRDPTVVRRRPPHPSLRPVTPTSVPHETV